MNQKLFTPTLITLLIFLLSPFSSKASIIPVTLGADSGIGSLREVVANASANDTITFEALLNGVPVTLINEITVDKSLTIMGNGTANTIISAGSLSRIFNISNDANVTISAIAMTNGKASESGGALFISGGATVVLDNCVVSDSEADGAAANQGGGGIYNGATLTLQNGTMVMNNTCTGTSGSGGGIFNDAGATLTITDCTISLNSANRAGGGIEDVSGSGTVTVLTNVTLNSNTAGDAPGNGGAIHITGNGDMQIMGGMMQGNIATAEGGALWNGAGRMTVNGVTIDGNEAQGNEPDQGGGGIYNLSGTLVVENESMITNNRSTGTSGSGGGILIDAGANAAIGGSTISGNSASRAGGGIEDASGDASVINVINSNITNNTTGSNPGNGGGVHITGAGSMQFVGGTVNSNTATAEGGGLWNGSGSMTVNGVVIDGNKASGNDADQGGGGIYNLSGMLIIEDNTMIINNTCDGTSGSGGGILNDVGGNLSISNSTISGNASNRAGGGIEDVSGDGTTVTLSNVVIRNNTTGEAPGNGGGIHITGTGNMTITGGAIINNTAIREGGGLWNGAGTMTVTNTSIDGNIASGIAADDGGGGVFNNGGTLMLTGCTVSNNQTNGTDVSRNLVGGNGAGIHNTTGGNMTLTTATISGNTSLSDGGGVYNEGTMTIITSTIANNSAVINGGGIAQTAANAQTTLQSSIVAGNTAVTGVDIYVTGGTIVSAGYNLIGLDDAAQFTAQATDLVGTGTTALNAMLADLVDNGGGIQTHALICGSAAINAGAPTIVTVDQRGMAVFGGQRDIGAYELQEACIEEEPVAPEINLVNPQFGADLIITAKLSGDNEVPAVTTDAVGVATISFNEDRTVATLNATVSNLSSAFTGAHIHAAPPGENGPVLIPFTADYVNGRITASIIDIDKNLLSQLINGDLYLNIHTENNPGGELRGNLQLEAPESFAGFLTGEQENPEVDVAATGVVSVHYTANTNVLEINALVDGLTGPITGAHLHQATEGENGPVVEGLTDFLTGNAIKIKIQAGDYIEALREGNIYLNIHTEANPSGEIRAQLEAFEGVVIDTWLNAEQEAHDITLALEGALGLGIFELTSTLDTISYIVQLTGLTDFATAAHLHLGELGVFGDVVFNMTDDLLENLIVGVDLPVNDTLVNTILSGDTYINVHTESNPMGEIRGQLYRLARDGYTYDVCSEQEIPAPTGAGNVSGSGMFAFNRDMDEAHLMVVVNELTSAFTGSHIHNAPAGETGGVIFPFTDDFMNGGAFLYFTGDSETPFNADFAEIIRNGNAYVNIHTENNPAGEVRGQIVKDLTCPILTSTIEVGKEVVSFEVYPNPATDNLTLALSNVELSILDKLEVSIFSNVGQKVKQLNGISANQEINISDLTPGMYYLTLAAEGVISGVKFVKE